jgi:hypothetical protein
MKKAHGMLSMSLGPVGRFFFLSHFIFILLTNLFVNHLNLLTMTEQPPPLTCELLAHRVDCRDNKMTGRGKMKKWRGGR